MAKTKKKKKGKGKEVELDDFTEVDAVEPEASSDEAASTEGFLSAKEAATAIGTDARTLRKFLRSKSGTIGQGHRWLIDPDDIEDLKAEFNNRPTRSSSNGDAAADEPKAKKSKTKKGKGKKAKVAEEVLPDEDIYGADADFEEFEVLDEIDDL